ncbi:MAG TPA: hydantoinase/oxoprolinase family protein, partial [Polyangia bacterium]|nr:hydantoinase/oxoprolinase family protein [Polyangia bacterium]
MSRWSFAIDVGGTFTDCVARPPEGGERTCKLLSTGIWKGACGAGSTAAAIVDRARGQDPDEFWAGFALRLLDAGGRTAEVQRVARFARAHARLELERPFSAAPAPGTRYELDSGEEAPIGAIRRVLGLRLGAPLPALDVRLGTTRGTNALLERTGARTALAVTRGFGDLLAIGTQARPHLFALAIRKPPPLCERVIEIDERLAADGTVLRAPDRARVRAQLEELRAAGIASLAVCLLHACVNPAHEVLVAQLARAVGFAEVSASWERAPVEKLLARAQTTVLDAYLNPVLRAYVAGLRRALGAGSRLHIMTSAGGLCAAERLTGPDSLLSGPAGGVVGVARAAGAAGFARAIGFDMGGTSTDVSRWDGRFELEHEAEKAGVRVSTPVLAIETVAAGGGSVCGFDGVKLTVGPSSAGADPGPACYGRGGPLTVTDCNLVLGRILFERFPFPLDRAAPLARLAALAGQIAAAPTGRPLSALALAQGFVEVANAAMARAIRAVSVARGYDPADHALVCFGGAGGQHACALARELRIRRVLIHPHAGVLSAWGIGRADLRRLREKSVLEPFSTAALARLEPLGRALAEAAAAEVAAEGVQPEPPRRQLDLRYQGVDAVLAVDEPADGDWRAAYERLHMERYGYRHAE